MFEKKIMNGTIEYKMPKEMAAMYLNTAKGDFAKNIQRNTLLKWLMKNLVLKALALM